MSARVTKAVVTFEGRDATRVDVAIESGYGFEPVNATIVDVENVPEEFVESLREWVGHEIVEDRDLRSEVDRLKRETQSLTFGNTELRKLLASERAERLQIVETQVALDTDAAIRRRQAELSAKVQAVFATYLRDGGVQPGVSMVSIPTDLLDEILGDES